MRPPDKRRNPQGRAAGSGYDAKATNLPRQYSPSALHFRTHWLAITARSLTVAQQPCPLTKSLVVHALIGEIREALGHGVRP